MARLPPGVQAARASLPGLETAMYELLAANMTTTSRELIRVLLQKRIDEIKAGYSKRY